MKEKITLILVTLLLGSFVGAGVFYAIPYSNLSREHASLENEYSDEIDELTGEYDSLTQRYNLLEEEHSSLSDEVAYLESEYRYLDSEYQYLFAANSVLEKKYSELLIEYIRAEKEPIPPFTVQGKHIYDKFNRRVTFKGFALDQGRFDWYRSPVGPFVQEDIDRIKDWGFHFVYSQLWWGQVETNQSQKGEYDYQNRLDRYHVYIDWCDEANLNWVFRFRVSDNDTLSGPDAWWGWCTAEYVCTEEGLERYCDFLKDIISLMESEHDNIVAYAPWHAPFHQARPTVEQRDFYHDRVIPEMVNAVRSVTDKPIILSTLHDDWWRMEKAEDSNVIYQFDYYDPVNRNPSSYEDQEIWEGTPSDIQEQWNIPLKALNFADTHDVPLYVHEFGIIIERQDQLNKLRLKLEILDQYDIGWCYWWYSWYESDFLAFNVFYEDGTPKQGLVDLLIEYQDWSDSYT
jgi:hypothetical protein